MTTPEYARDGYRFYSVSTPSVFAEFELPLDIFKCSPQERRNWHRLEDLAAIHQTHVQASNYRLG